jgi:hypothetical protein
MTLDLASLKTEILSQLEREDFALFYTDSGTEGLNVIYWDVKRKPAAADFLNAATKCGAKLITFFERVFSQVAIDEMIERLDDADLGRDEKRSYERRLKELQKFEGFTCELELSFEHGRHLYSFQVRTDWFEEFEDIFAEVAVGDLDNYEDEEEDEGPISGYFSRN